jgi:3-hydroxyisobutyrate dehydrogenase
MIAFIWQRDWETLGNSLAQKLVDSGYELTIFVRNGQTGNGSTKAALSADVRQAKSLAAAVKGAEIVLTLLGTSQEVEDVYLGDGGILAKAAPASLFIDLSTSSPRLAKELHALAAVHDHAFVEAPLEGDIGVGETESLSLEKSFGKTTPGLSASEQDVLTPNTSVVEGLRIFAAGESDNLKRALPILRILAPRVINVGLPGSGVALKLSAHIALACALMGVVEAITFATVAGVQKDRILEVINQGVAASAVARAFGKKILDEDFCHGCDLRLFFNNLTCALDAADELDLALPGIETAHQLYDLLVLVGGGQKGIHALALIYYDETRCARHGLNWELAQRAMDVYERANETYDDYDYDYDDEECGDPHCNHPHHHFYGDDERSSMGGYFSPN